MDQNAIQQKAYEFEMQKEQIKQIQMQAMQIQRQVQEISAVIASLAELKKSNSSQDAFIPLGAGVFSSGKITDSKEVLVIVGSGIAMKKSIDDALSYLGSKLDLLNKAFEELNAESNKVSRQAQEISAQLQGISEKKKNGK